MQNHSRVLIVFESPQSSCSRFRLRLERHHSDVPNVKLEEWRFINPYNIQITVPSKNKNKLRINGNFIRII